MKKTAQCACVSCGKFPLEKDEVGITKKLLGIRTAQRYCIECLAAFLEVTPEDIFDKIQLFKEDGCTLFK